MSYDCDKCGGLGHATEDCYMSDLGDLIDSVFDRVRDNRMLQDLPVAEDEDQ